MGCKRVRDQFVRARSAIVWIFRLPRRVVRRTRRLGEQAAQRGALRREQSRWSRALHAELKTLARPELLLGSIRPGSVPVIVCLWARPDRLQAIVDQLSAQATSVGVRLILWNNRAEMSDRYRSELAVRKELGAISSVEFYSARRNIRGIARFVVARHLFEAGERGAFITLDDDQDISPMFIDDLLAAADPRGVAGWWAFVYGDDYWDRRPATSGEMASYVGTGGAVFDLSIVQDLGFFTTLPVRFGYIEDIWASHWVKAGGGTLRKIDTSINLVQEELNQYHGLVALKPEFHRYLAENPPKPLSSDSAPHGH